MDTSSCPNGITKISTHNKTKTNPKIETNQHIVKYFS